MNEVALRVKARSGAERLHPNRLELKAGKRDRVRNDWNEQRLPALVRGDKAAWDAFVARHANVVYAAIHRAVAGRAHDTDAVADVFQDVFVRLCRNNYHLIKTYDPARAALTTWLTVIARSAAIDHLRRQRAAHVPLDDAGDAAAEVPRESERLRVPAGILTPRQRIVMAMIYNRDMDTEEIAEILGVTAQTVRSTHHKAIERLRAHFNEGGRS